jgi:hypothetical protein
MGRHPGIHAQANDYFALVHAMDADTVLQLIELARRASPAIPQGDELPPLLTNERIREIYRRTFPAGGYVFTNTVIQFARNIEHEYGAACRATHSTNKD